MSYTVTKSIRFEAAHYLPYHDGKCRRMHGHSWKADIIVRRVGLIQRGPKQGMVTDFGDIKHAVQPLVDDVLDHHLLNETTGLENPTSEAVAKFVFDWLHDKVEGLWAVEVCETCTSRARWCPYE